MVWTNVTVSQVVYKHSLLLEDRKTASYFHFHFDVQINPEVCGNELSSAVLRQRR